MAQRKKAKLKAISKMLDDLDRAYLTFSVKFPEDPLSFQAFAAFVRAYEDDEAIWIVVADPYIWEGPTGEIYHGVNERRVAVVSLKQDDFEWVVEGPNWTMRISRIFPGESNAADEVVKRYSRMPKAMSDAQTYIDDLILSEQGTELTP